MDLGYYTEQISFIYDSYHVAFMLSYHMYISNFRGQHVVSMGISCWYTVWNCLVLIIVKSSEEAK